MAKESKKAKKKTTKQKAGRKNLWDELNMEKRLDAVRGWALQGSTDQEMYEMLGVSKDTFYLWRKNKPEFYEAIRAGKFESNGEILNSAFKQTQGYFVTVTEPMKVKRGQDWEEIEMVTYDKFVPANTTMTLFMLKNRLPNQYKDKQEHNINANVGVRIIDDVDDE